LTNIFIKNGHVGKLEILLLTNIFVYDEFVKKMFLT